MTSRNSLASKFALAAGALVVAVVVLLGGAASVLMIRHVRDDVSEKLQTTVDFGGLGIEFVLNEATRAIRQFADNSLLATALVDSHGRDGYLIPFLRDYQVSGPVPVRLGLYDFQGNLLGANRDDLPASLGDAAWLKTVLDGASHAGLSDDGARLVIAMPVIYPATGLPEGFLAGQIEVAGFLAPEVAPLGSGATAVLRSRERVLVSANALPAGLEIVSVGRDLRLAEPLDRLALRLEIQEESRKVWAPLWALLTGLGTVGGAALLAAWTVAHALGRRLARPLRDLSEVAGKIASGAELAQRVPTDGPDEVGQLGRTFERMLGRLAEYQGDLERRVLERTRELEAAEQAVRDNANQLSAIVDNVIDGIITIDETGIIQSANSAAERIFGHARGDMIGRNVRMLMPEPHRSHHDGYLENYRRGGIARVIGIGREVEGQRADGSVFPVDLAVSRLELGGRLLFVGILRDITERKRAERMKSEFIATVSHELRTPLTSIRGSLGLLAGGVAGGLPPKAAALVGIAHKNAERLVILVNDILDIEKIESGSMSFHFSTLALDALLEQAVEATQGYARQFGVTLHLAALLPKAMVAGDGDRLMQVLANLLSNAIKFSPPDGVVTVGLEPKADGGWRVTVADQGPGIADDFKERIFSRFAQADAGDSRAKGGTGLGLSIAKAIVERHCGAIGYAPRPQGGTTFHIDLPGAAPHA